MAGNINVNFIIKKLPEKPWFWGVVIFIILLILDKPTTAFAALFLIFLFFLIPRTINAYNYSYGSRKGLLLATILCLFLVVVCGVFVPREWRGKAPEIKPAPIQTSLAIEQTLPLSSNQTSP